MKSLRICAAAIAATALLALSQAMAAPQPTASAGQANLEAPERFPPITPNQPNPIPFESLVAAAEAGNAEAMNLLGVLYTLGTLVPRDYSMALYWFQKAVDGGSDDAMNNLGTMYLLGIGVSRDYVNALRWHERSAARGNAHSMYSVAVMADKGLGTARDPQLARAMYLKAAEAGFAPAMLQVSDDYASRSASKHDLIEAYAWLQVAWQSGLPEELQISALSRIEDLEARLGPERRDEARVRATQLAALVKTRVLPSGGKVPAPAQQSKEMI
ncbi:MAG TPA: tetratricopeptide repeat protein [Casimicrobiaceae bacterium]|nr:tetratricopeptide repeat protein [Casimicrobiaceae bacterium]